MFLSRSPLLVRRRAVRLTCVRHAASVDPEPGSNSSKVGEASWHLAFTAAPVRGVVSTHDARNTRQLVRCRRHKSERAVQDCRTRQKVSHCNGPRRGARPVVADREKYTRLTRACQANPAPIPNHLLSLRLRARPSLTTVISIPCKTKMSSTVTIHFHLPARVVTHRREAVVTDR